MALDNTFEAFPGIGQLYAARTPRKKTYTARLVLVNGVEVTRDTFATIDAARQWGRDIVASIQKAEGAVTP